MYYHEQMEPSMYSAVSRWIRFTNIPGIHPLYSRGLYCFVRRLYLSTVFLQLGVVGCPSLGRGVCVSCQLLGWAGCLCVLSVAWLM